MSCKQYCANRLEHSSFTRFKTPKGDFRGRRNTLLFCTTKREQFGFAKLRDEANSFFKSLRAFFYGNCEDYAYGTYLGSGSYSVSKDICLCDCVCMHLLKVYRCVNSYIKAVKTLLRQQQPQDSIGVQASDLPAQMSRHMIRQQCIIYIGIIQCHACIILMSYLGKLNMWSIANVKTQQRQTQGECFFAVRWNFNVTVTYSSFLHSNFQVKNASFHF